MNNEIENPKENGTEVEVPAPEGFDWLSSREAIVEHVATALSPAHGPAPAKLE